MGDRAALVAALASAVPGTTILIQPGTYAGDIQIVDIHGTADAPITITSADPMNPAIIGSAGEGLKFSDAQYLKITSLTTYANTFNGINIDDGGTYDTPSHHITIDRVTVRLTDNNGISNAIKVSGVDDLVISDCTIDDWGNGGSGIDMVGCHRVSITGNTFRDSEYDADDGLQAKGGSSDIDVARNTFIHAGQRPVQIGGSAISEIFRPSTATWEVTDMHVHDNVFIGGETAVAFTSNGPGCSFTDNTVVQPITWVVRILNENIQSPPQGGLLDRNLFVFAGPAGSAGVNAGGADPALVVFGDNFWATSPDGLFVDSAGGDYRLRPGSPALGYGV